MSEQASFTLRNRNPDVLTCIANLSNDEVFTPPELANQMLDSLTQAWAEDNDGANLWEDRNVKFLDPCAKSGVFLREITTRLTIGLENEIPNLEERVEHILSKQVYGIGITQLTSLLARRSVYCSKDADGEHSIAKSLKSKDGNICYKRLEHTWNGAKCLFCGVPKNVLDRGRDVENYAYAFVHAENIENLIKDFFGEDMQFDVIIGNPPYQINDDGNGISAKPIFHLFVDQAKKLSPKYLTMVIPARWYAGGKGLDDFREEMLNDNQIKKLVDFESSKECFDGVNIAGGICYFLWMKNHDHDCEVVNIKKGIKNICVRSLNEHSIFIRSNNSVSIIRKILEQAKDTWTNYNYPRNPFGFSTKERGSKIKLDDYVELLSSQGFGYIRRDIVIKNTHLINSFKVLIGRLVPSNGELDVNPDDGYRVITNTRILHPNQIHTESYLLLGVFDTLKEAKNFEKYINLKFSRFLIRQAISSVNVTKECFRFLPREDFNVLWTDEKLYKKYNFTQSEIDIVERTMRKVEPADD